MNAAPLRGSPDEHDLLIERAYVASNWIKGNVPPIIVDDPFTAVPNLGAAETLRAIEAASAAFPAWSALTARERGAVLRLGLELGDNAPFLVFDDADLDAAVEAVLIAKFRNGGRSCVGANRIYAQRGIHDQLVEALATRVAAMVAGEGFDPTSTIGPLISRAAVGKVEAHRDDALSSGGHLVTSGSGEGERISTPTLVADVKPGARFASEETFGPLAAVVPFATANATPFGLATYLCTHDPKTIARVSRGLEAGMVGINTGIISTAVAPFGGVKMSGRGRKGSAHGLTEYQNLKYLCQAEV